MNIFEITKPVATFLLSIFIPFVLSADSGTNSGNNNGDPDKDVIPLRRGNLNPSRGPRVPSNQHLWFSYDSASQQCEVTMSDGIEYLNVVVEQLPVGFYYVGDVTPDNTTMSVEIPAGYYRITCTTDEGVTFVGEGDIN